MNDTTMPKAKSHRDASRRAFDRVALVLQGGGALGAYQAGVYQALGEADIHPDWVAGISIGAINAAIIAGNPPEARVGKLRQFWELVTDGHALLGWPEEAASLVAKGDAAREWFNQVSAGRTLLTGTPGFFAPRLPPPWLQPSGTPEATSYYETGPLEATLERLIDFDRIDAGLTRLSVGAVNVRSGNFVYFDTTTHRIRPEHVLASGALPPGFAPVEIEGEHYWDGGLVSNTPLQWVVEAEPRRDSLIIQVDLWNARGRLPRTMSDVMVRQKEIQYSSRTRDQTDRFKRLHDVRCTLGRLLAQLPDDLKQGRDFEVLSKIADHTLYNIVHLIYRAKHYEGHSKDYEFSRLSMEEHWRAGYNDAVRTLSHPEVLERPQGIAGVCTFDLARDGRE